MPKRILPQFKHNNTVCYYNGTQKRCQTLFGAIDKLFLQNGDFFMRIDKFLKISRILKRRTVAQDAANAGKITVNGREAKPSTRVKAGDIVELSFASGTLRFKILEIREFVKKDEAQSLYEVLV